MQQYVLITGASTGIGHDLARLYAENRKNLILVARSEDALLKLKQELENTHGVDVQIAVKDLSIQEEVNDLVKQITSGGFEISRLINNAGVGRGGDFLEDNITGTLSMMNLNMNAVVFLTFEIGQMMHRQGYGKILNVASVAGFLPGPYMNVYYATKAFVLHFTEALMHEFRGKKSPVTVACLCPGPTRTQFFKARGLERSQYEKSFFVQESRDVAKYAFNRFEFYRETLIIPSWFNSVLTMMPRFFPRGWVVKIMGFINAYK